MDNALTISAINNYPPETYNRLFPATMTEISPFHRVIVNIVKIDPNPDNKEVYVQKDGGLSLTKIACLRLMAAANVMIKNSESVPPDGCMRCKQMAEVTKIPSSCGTCPSKYDVKYEATILVPEPSGGYTPITQCKEIRKEDYKGAREHMAAQCETKALLRALRVGLGLKSSYTTQELSRSFAVALIVPNASDPEIKAVMIERYKTSQDALFGGVITSKHQLGGGENLRLGEGITGEATVIDPYPDNEHLSEKKTACCEECGLIIEPTGEWTVEMIVAELRRRHGRVICSNCLNGKTGGAQA